MRDIGLLILRLGFGGVMLTHGLPKLMNFNEYAQQFPALFGVPPKVNLSLAIGAEVFCSLLVIIGFKTKYVTLPLVATMFTAFFIIHAADPFQVKELALLYMMAFITLFFTGAGKYSVDKE